MSLIHWWSLNGDVQDKVGISLIGEGSYTLSTNGKIGSCLKNNYPGFQTSIKLVDEWSHWKHSVSMSCWVKINYDECNTYLKTLSYSSTATSPTGCLIGQTSYGGLGIHWYTNTMYNNGTITDLTTINFRGYTRGSSSTAATSSVTVESDKWYHMTLVADYDKKVLRFYVNGSQIGGDTSYSSIPEMTDVRYFGWGRGEVWGGNGPGGCLPMRINDVRLYDHALSQAEVKELSKALVVHYTFNDVLAEPTTNIISGIQSAYGKASLESGRVKINWSPSGADSYFFFSSTQTIKANSVYTLSFDCEDLKSGEVVTFAVNNLSAASYNVALKNGRNSLTFTAGSDLMNDINTYNRLFFDDKTRTDGAVFYLSNFQLEERDHATPYTPTSRESMLINEAGYANPSSVTNFKLSTVTNKGSYSGYFDGQTSCIDTPVIKTNMFTEDYTLSFWVHPLDSGRSVYFGDHQLSSIPTINFERNADGTFRYYHNGSPDKSFANTNTPQDTWTMLTVTYTPGTMVVYKNGVLAETFSHTASIAKDLNGVMRIGRDSRTGSDYGATPLYGYISDFRFYVTCLSADDVAELYKTKAYITNKGDVESHQFVEKTENLINEKDFAITASQTAGNGTLEMRKGVMSYGLQADTFYYGEDTTAKVEQTHSIFKNKFKEGKQYYFDLYMDVDTMYYTDGKIYVPGGFVIRYTDGTTDIVRATSTNGASGWQHVEYYSNPDKTIYGLGVYYYINTRWYLRHDSGIYEMDKDNVQVTSKYTVETTQITETSYQTNALIHLSGNIVGREIIEI